MSGREVERPKGSSHGGDAGGCRRDEGLEPHRRATAFGPGRASRVVPRAPETCRAASPGGFAGRENATAKVSPPSPFRISLDIVV